MHVSRRMAKLGGTMWASSPTKLYVSWASRRLIYVAKPKPRAVRGI
ncbi:MAG: hypothetical protein LBM98_08540 [Oscillospiraceae bacterium]|nr:hypothetical protein [Oscillospiraceae bacterium]